MTLQNYKKQKMQDPEFAKAYEEIQPEMQDVRANIEKSSGLEQAGDETTSA